MIADFSATCEWKIRNVARWKKRDPHFVWNMLISRDLGVNPSGTCGYSKVRRNIVSSWSHYQRTIWANRLWKRRQRWYVIYSIFPTTTDVLVMSTGKSYHHPCIMSQKPVILKMSYNPHESLGWWSQWDSMVEPSAQDYVPLMPLSCRCAERDDPLMPTGTKKSRAV